MPELRKREATLRAQLDALDAELHDAETYLKLTETLDAFRARLVRQRRDSSPSSSANRSSGSSSARS